jgi:hypothetical protein
MKYQSTKAWWILLLALVFKILLMPSYHSTDFEVHRNWLVITSELRPSQWYFDTTSQWTLDYPPMFAWFERALVPAARLVDPLMLKLGSTNYMSNLSFLFMRCSVCFTGIVTFLYKIIRQVSMHLTICFLRYCTVCRRDSLHPQMRRLREFPSVFSCLVKCRFTFGRSHSFPGDKCLSRLFAVRH